MPNATFFAVITGTESVKTEGVQPIELHVSYSEGHRCKTYHLCWLLLMLERKKKSDIFKTRPILSNFDA